MSVSTRYNWKGWAVALAAAVGVVGLAVLPPFVGETVRAVVMHAFAGVCHQLPARSAHLGGVPLALCDRCLGIYSGVALGILAYPVIPALADRMYRRAGLMLVVALVPLALDWAGPVLSAWPNTPWSRAVTGAVFGVMAGVLVARAAARFNRASPADAALEGTIASGG